MTEKYEHGKTGVNKGVDQRTIALGYFKDWTNYLLVTSVVAMGWIVKDNSVNGFPKDLAIIALAGSIVFAIFTLALIPIVAERIIDNREESIYSISARFKLFLRWGNASFRIKWVCFPQHFLFIVGIISYAYGAVII